MGRRVWRLGIAVAAAIFALDQATKAWVMEILMPSPRVIPIGGFLNLVTGWNRGVSFGLLSSEAWWVMWMLSALAVAIVAALFVWLWRARGGLTGAAIGTVIGGALGNLVDRARFGAVFDFVDLHVGSYHWPAFNVADAAITLGAALLIGESLFGGAHRPKHKGQESAPLGNHPEPRP